MKIKRRFPNFFSGFEDETEFNVNSKEELLEIHWIKELNKIPDYIGVFYSPNSFSESPDLLMALYEKMNGKIEYYAIGYIYGDGSKLGLKNYIEYV